MACLVATVLLTMLMLDASGYLSSADTPATVSRFAAMLRIVANGDIEPEFVAARRGALAVSGVLLAATMVISLTAVLWVRAQVGRLDDFSRSRASGALVGATLVALAIAAQTALAHDWSFVSQAGLAVLTVTQEQLPSAGWLPLVPAAMFLQGVALPTVLGFGACLFLRPPGPVANAADARRRIEDLKPRVRELDHMLYLGAMALVLGTLQLSASLSVPLARMPSEADVKTTIDLCKATSADGKNNPFYANAAASAPSRPSPLFHAPLAPSDCEAVPSELVRVDAGRSLRSLIHALTLAFGLAFSMMLVAIYLPAMIRLREWMDEARLRLPAPSASGDAVAGGGADLGDADPLHRLAAALATLGPVIAGLVANTLTAG